MKIKSILISLILLILSSSLVFAQSYEHNVQLVITKIGKTFDKNELDSKINQILNDLPNGEYEFYGYSVLRYDPIIKENQLFSTRDIMENDTLNGIYLSLTPKGLDSFNKLDFNKYNASISIYSYKEGEKPGIIKCNSESNLNAIKEFAIENGFDESSINVTYVVGMSDPEKAIDIFIAILSDAKGNKASFGRNCKTGDIYSPQLSELKVDIRLWAEMQQVGDNVEISIIVFKNLSSEPSKEVAKAQLEQSGMKVVEIYELKSIGIVMLSGRATRSDLYKISKLQWIDKGNIGLNEKMSVAGDIHKSGWNDLSGLTKIKYLYIIVPILLISAFIFLIIKFKKKEEKKEI